MFGFSLVKKSELDRLRQHQVQSCPPVTSSPEAQIADAADQIRTEQAVIITVTDKANMLKKMMDMLKSEGFNVTPSGQMRMKEKLHSKAEALGQHVKNTSYGFKGLFRKVTDPVSNKLHDLQELGKEPR